MRGVWTYRVYGNMGVYGHMGAYKCIRDTDIWGCMELGVCRCMGVYVHMEVHRCKRA